MPVPDTIRMKYGIGVPLKVSAGRFRIFLNLDVGHHHVARRVHIIPE